jgi:hypothetical protein
LSNGYLLAARPDLAAAHEISVGFGLEVIDAATVSDPAALGEMLAGAANVGLLISVAAAQDHRFVALMRALGARLQTPQLILADQSAYAPFSFLPAQWPAMLLEDARGRAVRRGAALPPPAPEPPSPPPQAEPPPQTGGVLDDLIRGIVKPAPEPPRAEPLEAAPPPEPEPEPELEPESEPEAPAPTAAAEEKEPGRAMVRHTSPPREAATEEFAGEPAPAADAAPAPEHAAESRAEDAAEFTPVPQPAPAPRSAPPRNRETAPADATAFAPKKLRRATPELVRVIVHQPKQLRDVLKAAKKVDPYSRPAPQGMSIGDIALGANVGIALETHGARCEGALQRRAWAGEPIEFAFPVEADGDAKQAVFLARVFVDDAQIGVLAFTRPVSDAKSPAPPGEIRLTRHKRVFISYSAQDRETVSIIATAYQLAGVAHFWDRTSLKSGEEWSPRLKKEIERADLFHLCWSKAAAQSEWVAKEAEHALKRKRAAKRPEITVQMLDGPPWAPHPPQLDAINFDDFVRAAIVGYARGDGA